jgi:hypothetical protein
MLLSIVADFINSNVADFINSNVADFINSNKPFFDFNDSLNSKDISILKNTYQH